jgi:FkbM family methyltransferase
MSVIADVLTHLVTQVLGRPPAGGVLTQADLDEVSSRLAADRHDREASALAYFCRTYTLAFNNWSYDHATNGEAALLRRLAPFGPRVILDVGANTGRWAALAHEHLPAAVVHAFEILPQTFEVLAARAAGEWAGQGWLRANDFGLAAESGELTVNVFEGRHELTTVADLPHGAGARKVACRVVRGDDYVADNEIAHIDLLKIDTEGAEHLVLRGFEQTFARGAVDVCQFEYGQASILTRFLLADFHAFFDARGFSVGKLYPDGVEFRPYQLDDEDFLGPNYVACRRDRPELLAALSAPASATA